MPRARRTDDCLAALLKRMVRATETTTPAWIKADAGTTPTPPVTSDGPSEGAATSQAPTIPVSWSDPELTTSDTVNTTTRSSRDTRS